MIRGPLSSLGARFFLGLFVLVVLGTAAFGWLVARGAGREVRDRSSRIVESSAADLEREFDAVADAQAELMDQAVKKLSERFGRELEDVPFELYEGREDLLRELLKERLGELRRRNRENSAVIAEMFRARERREISATIAALRAQQGETIAAWSRKATRDVLLVGGGFLLVVGLLVGMMFWITVLEPLRRATEVMESIRRGDFGRRIPEEGGDELARMAASFNGMADALEASRRDLEERVARKTAALREALEDQRGTNDRLAAALVELESAQHRLVESAKMAALGTMAQGMAHEFNNVLGGIAGCAEDLLEDEEDPERRRVLDVVVRSARRATVVTRNLKSFSQGEEGVAAPCSLEEIARSALTLVEAEASRRGVSLALRGGDLPALVTDGRALQQVLLNLLVNAVEASDEGGEVVVTLERGETGQAVEVADRGRGIAPEHRERVFEPFFTTKAGTALDRGGTGLGLAVVHGIVTRLGGTVELRSEGVGRGCAFRVEIPAGRNGA